MTNKETIKSIAERILYLLTVAVTPGIPLFFLYARNSAQGLLFSHFLIFGGALAVLSLIAYLLISRLYLRRRRTMLLLSVFWLLFWLYTPLLGIMQRLFPSFQQAAIFIGVGIVVIITALVLRRISINRQVSVTIAVILCVLFMYNFIPEAIGVSASNRQRAINEQTGDMPYEIKTEFRTDQSLPSPNIYWLHMDGMMGFDAVEHFFNDPQMELKEDLADRGFIINESAQSVSGSTVISTTAMFSPIFYDSYLADVLTRVDGLSVTPRISFIHADAAKNGFTIDDIRFRLELLRAFSDAGYYIAGNQLISHKNDSLDLWLINNSTAELDDNITSRMLTYEKVVEFKDLIVNACALLILESYIDSIVERYAPELESQPIPEYTDDVDRYITGSASNTHKTRMVREMKHTTTLPEPRLIIYMNIIAHVNDSQMGRYFPLDENGNNRNLSGDLLDINFYLPQHKYAAREMLAQVDTILENDPEAVIILQADHGIHGAGNTGEYFDSKFMYERGYSLEDQLNISMSVISAVRVPPQYGELTEPLDPLDITRWLVNNFVGERNYEYLYYSKDS